MVIGIYAGTFDPLTLGHLDIIKRSFSFCDKLIIGVGVNPTKKTLFSESQRVQQIGKSMQPLFENTKHEMSWIATPFYGLLVNFAQEQKATILIRGIRSVSDFEYELTLANANKVLAPGLQTVFLPTSPELMVVSSSLAKEVARYHGDVSPFVPKNIEEDLKSVFAKV